MAVDKLVDSSQLNSDLTSVANAIRAKSGGSSQLAFPAGFVSAIQNIPSGGGDTVFVVTVGWDSEEEMWVPDATFSEIQAADTAGKTITVQASFSEGAIADGYYEDGELMYVVYFYDEYLTGHVYVFTSSGLELVNVGQFLLPSGTINISQSGNTDVTAYATANVPAADAWAEIPSSRESFVTEDGVRKFQVTPVMFVDIPGWVSQDADGATRKYNAIPANTTITPSSQAQTVGGAKYVLEGPITIAPAQAGDDVLVVTISWDDNDDMYEPDATFAEIAAAYQAEKQIVVSNADGMPSDGYYDEYTPAFVYVITYWDGDEVHSVAYEYTSTGIVLLEETVSYDTSGASSISASEVAYGAAYYDANGYHTGTATRRSSSDMTLANDTVTAPAGFYAQAGTKAIPSNYVGSGITRRDSNDITFDLNDAMVDVPAGYYSEAASAELPAGTDGTPTATKGTVSNHSVSVTPSVTNQTGWILGRTKTGTAVTVTASELVSGSETKTSNGTYDVTNLASLVVAVPFQTIYSGSGAPSAAQGVNGDIYIQTGS